MSRENKEPLIQSFSPFFSTLLQGNIVSSLHLPQLPAVTKRVVSTKEILIYDKVYNSEPLTTIITGQTHLGSTGLNRRA